MPRLDHHRPEPQIPSAFGDVLQPLLALLTDELNAVRQAAALPPRAVGYLLQELRQRLRHATPRQEGGDTCS